MPIGILEVTGVSAPEGLSGRLHNEGAGRLRLVHDGIDLLLRGNVVPEREVGGTGAVHGETCVMGETFARPDRKLQARLEVEERYRAMLELLSDDTRRLQPETVPIEPKRPLQVVDADGEHAEPWFHRNTSTRRMKDEGLGGRLEQFDRVTVRIFQLNLFSSRTCLDLVPELQARLLQRR